MANTVPPIPPTPPTLAGSPAPAPPALTVANPPPGLSQVAPGTAIQGTVISAGAPGAFGIQTPVGTLSALSNLALPNNAILSLLLQSLGPQARLLITAINGQPPGPLVPTQPGAIPSALTPGTAVPTPPVSVGTAPVITAIVLPNAASRIQSGSPQLTPTTGPQGNTTPTIPGAAPAITAGSALAQLAKTAATKTGISTASRASVGGNTPAASTGVPSGTAPGTTHGTTHGTAQNTHSAGTQIPVRITTIQPSVPGTTTPLLPSLSPTPLSAGQTLTGIVTGTTLAGQATIQTPAGQLSIPMANVPPVGSSITFEITGQPVPPSVLNTTPTTALDIYALSREWPALKEALQVLQESQPGIAQQLINMVIPRLDIQLAANILFFLAGLRGGDIRSWLGEDAMRALEDSRPDVARQLRSEFGQLARVAEDSSSNDWRHMLIPLNTGDAIEPIHMFMRQRKKKDGDDGDTETRFVIDVGLSQLGRIQLDGLIGERNKRLDLIVRSHNPLPSSMQNDIRTIYISAGEITGMTGGLSFQAAPPNFLEPQTPEAPDSGAGIIA
jgi:hypothetical protein